MPTWKWFHLLARVIFLYSGSCWPWSDLNYIETWKGNFILFVSSCVGCSCRAEAFVRHWFPSVSGLCQSGEYWRKLIMFQGYSWKQWVQIPRKQAVLCPQLGTTSPRLPESGGRMKCIRFRGCCRYVHGLIITFFFSYLMKLTKRETKTSDYFMFFLFLCLRIRGCHRHVELGVNSPSSTFTSTTFNLFVMLRARLSTLNALDFFFFLQLFCEQNGKRNKIKRDFEKVWNEILEKKKWESLYFRCFSFWAAVAQRVEQVD